MDPANKTYNNVSINSILNPLPIDENLVERISYRRIPFDISISEPKPDWPTHFETFKSRILSAFNSSPTQIVKVHSINHIGSTSVPTLPAKNIIDIDLVLSPSNTVAYEADYVPLLESAGFQFVLREPAWYEHRFFIAKEVDQPMNCNLHVWGPGSAEVERHVIFRDYLRSEEGREDRKIYAEVKRESARASKEMDEDVTGYTNRKEAVLRGILDRAFKWVGILEE
ncbi:Putative grpB/Dephospho-CoA kinase, Nucleotidyltransferase superfamily [Septoria linicola]|uniref:GrpB/Dephospho-CoA kinase, Nucleotidyltransferase superfamily n=1 Tax=Septoria linicola TaxID=215465 RepID=A0A9Q9EKA3_9PEZI|nr:Putative grpB/Dephospho-CoA kinase, Nucleotidyltransferase superfamily [Septoria linicola]